MARTNDIRTIQRGCTNKDMKVILLAVLRGGHRYKLTKSGVLVYGPDGGTAGTHLTGSCRRGAENFRRDISRIGITV